MHLINVKIKKCLPDAVIPAYARHGDACFDLAAASHPTIMFRDGSSKQVGCEEDFMMLMFDKMNTHIKYIEYDTGLAMEIPEGFKGLCPPRSSISKTWLSLANSVGYIDSGYRDTIKARFRVVGLSDDDIRWQHIYHKGDKVIQMELVPVWKAEFSEVEELSSSERGKGGFGSTGA